MRTRTILISLSVLCIIAIPFVTKTNDSKGPGSVRFIPNIAYINDKTKPARSSQMLDLYVPTKSYPLIPLIVFIHGGAWLQGDKDEAKDIGVLLAQNGFAVASLNYRLTGEAQYPSQLEDCQKAIAFLRTKAPEYGYSADRIGVWGVSAGGHLAALLGTLSGDKNVEISSDSQTKPDLASQVQAVVDWCGLTDLNSVKEQAGSKMRIDYDSTDGPVAKLLGGLAIDKKELAAEASPVTYVSKNDPPFLIVHGDIDDLVPFAQSQELSEKLAKAGVPTKLVVVQGAGHQLGSEQEFKRIMDFFKQTLIEGKRQFQVDG
ncbi:hypothetical protein BH11CYA1_BH11CYA1_40940 [soil metagenome]